MPLPSSSTVGDIRTAVLERLGLPTDGTASANGFKQIEQFIRSAARLVAAELDMLDQRVTESVTLTALDGSLDWPEDAEAIEAIEVVHTNGRRYEVRPGVRQNERDSAIFGNTNGGLPLIYEIEDGNILIWPVPSTDYPTAIITYTSGFGALADTTDEVPVDAEAVIQQVCMTWRASKGLPVSQTDQMAFERYLARIRAQNSDGSGAIVGGARSQRWLERRPNRVGSRGLRDGSAAPYTADWNPY